jgi:hypothetical protein
MGIERVKLPEILADGKLRDNLDLFFVDLEESGLVYPVEYFPLHRRSRVGIGFIRL